MWSSPCIPKGDDIAPKGTKKGSWGEKNRTLFTYKVYVYKTYLHTVYLWCENVIGEKGKIREKMFTNPPWGGDNTTKVRNIG